MSLALFTADSHADNSFKVRVIADEKNEGHEQLLSTLRNRLISDNQFENTVSLEIVSVNDLGKYGEDNKPDLVIAVGTLATLAAAREKKDAPIISVLIPHVSYNSIVKDYFSAKESQGGQEISAIYLDQPFSRRFALVNELLPQARAVGIILGPGTIQYRQELLKTAKAYNLELHVGEVQDESQLVPTLESVLKRSQVLFAILDPLVFNRANAQTVLLATYRHRIPIIGISSAYIDAGALAAVYSTPEQIGQQLAEMLFRLASKPGQKIPPPQYPEYFSAKVNKHFARTLGIKPIEERELIRRLSEQTGSEP
ncbi:MAG: hypothetical protein JXA04_02325 [Gammaproteobacteria bacterium]|nr:hypothetical protein [Gammaproteobacteria bacterium]